MCYKLSLVTAVGRSDAFYRNRNEKQRCRTAAINNYVTVSCRGWWFGVRVKRWARKSANGGPGTHDTCPRNPTHLSRPSPWCVLSKRTGPINK